jgi:acetylornithine deacetylase/succinyl-diaminopimelate desuccinylase-like protein
MTSSRTWALGLAYSAPATLASVLATLAASLIATLSTAVIVAFATLAVPAQAEAQAAAQAADMSALADEAVDLLQQYLRVNTINPPGNESRAVEFFARIFDAEGIDWDSAESAPGRGNIWARLRGGDEPALILLHHSDVVPADERYWSQNPLGGEIVGGHIYGRGALDTKTGGILQLAAFLALHRSGVELDRDVIFMATADEEAGGAFGAGWLVQNRPELFAGVGYLINEGGGGSVIDGEVQFGIEVTQKVPYWLRLTSTGEPGHGSRPNPSSSVTEMIEALARLRAHEFEPRVVDAVQTMFAGMAPRAPIEWQERFSDIRRTARDPEALKELQLFQPGLHALTRNTCSITRLSASDKINVVPPETTAEVDCRLVPDQDPQAFLDEMAEILGPEIEVEVIIGFSPAVSTTDTDLYRIIESVTGEEFPDAPFVPQVVGGFTDSHFFRDLGIVSYGYEPTATPDEDESGLHGNDERVTVHNVRRGTRLMVEIVRRFVAGGRIISDRE